MGEWKIAKFLVKMDESFIKFKSSKLSKEEFLGEREI